MRYHHLSYFQLQDALAALDTWLAANAHLRSAFPRIWTDALDDRFTILTLLAELTTTMESSR